MEMANVSTALNILLIAFHWNLEDFISRSEVFLKPHRLTDLAGAIVKESLHCLDIFQLTETPFDLKWTFFKENVKVSDKIHNEQGLKRNDRQSVVNKIFVIFKLLVAQICFEKQNFNIENLS